MATQPRHKRMTAEALSQSILGLLSFNPEDGRIWLNDKRMMLLDVATFQAFRTKIIDALGLEQARRELAIMGFEAGQRDAQIVRAQWPAEQQVAMGPHFHSIAGIVQVELVNLHNNRDGTYKESEWIWYNSVEADAHINHYGLGTHAACWMEAGYATGFVSGLLRQQLLFREISCRAMGGSCCRVVARPVDDWDDPEERGWFAFEKGPKTRQKSGASAPPDVPVPQGEEKDNIIGNSPALRVALAHVKAVAATRASVLVTGESGVGKELFARRIHDLSDRANQSFIAVNCGAIPEGLVEADLFGVERGAFTGAVASRAGRFERAHGGTLFLDEIGTLSLVAQAKLLRVIQEGEVERVGGVQCKMVDVRLIAATNVDLREAVAAGTFREDLFFRLNVFPINLPPLRERREDIPPLVFHFINTFNKAYKRSITHLDSEAMRLLLNYRFPGNVRECRNLIERAVILAEGSKIEVPHLFSEGVPLFSPLFSVGSDGRMVPANAAGGDQQSVRLDDLAEAFLHNMWGENGFSLDAVEGHLRRLAARTAMEKADGNVTEAARLLGLRRHRLDYIMKQDDL